VIYDDEFGKKCVNKFWWI